MRKYRCRRPSSANRLAEKTRNGSWVRPKIAGMESTANSTSVTPMAMTRMSSGVAWRRPRTRVVGRGRPAEGHPGRGVDEEPPEEIFHPRELLQGGTADGDEQAAQQQGEQDPEQQHPAVVPACHPGTADQQDEHQEVVERQAVFGQPAGEELPRRGPAAHGGDQRAERHRQGDRPRRPQRCLAQPLRSTPPGADEKVGAQENGKGRDGRGPGPEGYVKDTHGIRVPAIPAPASRPGWPGGSLRGSAPRRVCHPR